MFLNLKHIFAPFAFVLFYYLHNYFKYKTLFTSGYLNHIFRGDNPQIETNISLNIF